MKTKIYGIEINPKVFEYTGQNQTILSVGCGSAKLEELAEQKGNKVYGMDISKDALKIAKKRITKTLLGDIEKIDLPFKKNFFDLIVFADVLEHLKNPSDCVQKLKPYLKENGTILISIPNIANWSIRLRLLFGNFDYQSYGTLDKTHLRFFTLKTAKKLIKEAGFQIIKLDFSTSLVNICYEHFLKLAEKNSQKEMESSQNIGIKKSYMRKLLKITLEWTDDKLTKLFPGLFAYQFIIIAKKTI